MTKKALAVEDAASEPDSPPSLLEVYAQAEATKKALTAEISDKRKDLSGAQADLATRQERRLVLLLEADDATLAAHDEDQARASRAVDRLNAQIDKLGVDLREAETRERDVFRDIEFDCAKRAEAEAEDLITNKYTKLAAEIVDVLKRLTELRATIDEVNRKHSTPGYSLFVLERCRHRVPDPARIVKAKRRGAVNRAGQPMTQYKLDASGNPIDGSWAEIVDEVAVPEFVYRQLEPLVDTVSLPPIRPGDLSFWDPTSLVRWHP